MFEEQNGQTEEISGGCEERLPARECDRLGFIPSQGEIDGIEQGGISRKNCERGNTTGSDRSSGHDTLSKALQRLELIESSALNYVLQAKEGLETRLEEVKLHESQLKKDIAELKKELYDLASQQKKSPQ